MGRKKNNKGKSKNIFFKLIGIISTIVFIVFGIMICLLNMIPLKYLLMFYIISAIIYTFLLLLVFVKKIKVKIKIVSLVLLIIFGIIFGFGIKYLNDTMNFIDVINNELFQKEAYYLMTLKKEENKNINDLNDSYVGVYKSSNSDKAIKELSKKINVKRKQYSDIVEMFEDLQDKKIDAVLINESTKNLLSTELSDMKLELNQIYKVYISIEKDDIVKIVDVTKKVFNIYVAGGDAYGGIENVTNTDVNVVITVDPINNKILLTSIPRDYYVLLPGLGNNAYDKLTHAGYYGIEESVKTIENLLDIDVNYYVKVNFSTIEGVIDAIGGVDVNSDFNFCVTTTGVCVKKGNNHLNGYQAVMFARERKSFNDGDIQRVKNQQKVIESIINKVTSSTKLVTNFSQILDSVSSSLSTNMDTKSINRFVRLQLNNMSGWQIESQNLIGTDYYTTNTYTFPGLNLYVMKQDDESINQSKEKIKSYTNKQ